VTGGWASVLPRIATPAPSWACSRSYPGQPGQVAQARAFLAYVLHDCPVADDAVLLCSELCANAVQYSESRRPRGQFTLHAKVCPGSWVWCGVEDEGGTWRKRPRDPERMHGLDIVCAVTRGGWGVVEEACSRLVWYRLAWAAAGDAVPLLVLAS
jgi:anti-sigma regulatory factor (Ser/Thr protein kinase)